MSIHDDLGIRMKTFYEQAPKTKLMRRTPVIVRIDGKAFKTFTKGFQKPFDEVLIQTMQETTKYLCENIQGCVLGYTQSDEISLVLIDYQSFETTAWHNYEVQEVCSDAASMATRAFNKFFRKNVLRWWCAPLVANTKDFRNRESLYLTYLNAQEKGATFDARCFNIPKEEVANYLYWRQIDASNNSIQMVGRANFSQEELQKKSLNDIHYMLRLQKGINWNDLPTYLKRGACVIYESYQNPNSFTDDDWVSGWTIDKDIPKFKDDGRGYVDRLIW